MPQYNGPWEPTPWWIFWRRMIGHDMRRYAEWCGLGHWEGAWVYGNSQKVARDVLRSLCPDEARPIPFHLAGDDHAP